MGRSCRPPSGTEGTRFEIRLSTFAERYIWQIYSWFTCTLLLTWRAMTGLALLFSVAAVFAIVGVVVQSARLQRNFLVNKPGHEIRFHAKPGPVYGLELVQIGDATNKPKMFQVWLRRALPRIAWRAHCFSALLVGEQGVSHRSWLPWDFPGGKIYRPIARRFRDIWLQFGVVLKPTIWKHLERRPVSKILDAVMSFDFELRDYFESINRDRFVQSNPSAFSIYRGFPLYAGLFLYRNQHAIRNASINDSSNHGSPRRVPNRLLYGILFTLGGLSTLDLLICKFDSDRFAFLFPLLFLIAFVISAYGVAVVLDALTQDGDLVSYVSQVGNNYLRDRTSFVRKVVHNDMRQISRYENCLGSA